MNFSYNWLQLHFDDKLPKPEDLGSVVGLHSFELEGIEEAPHGDTLIDWDVLPNRSSDSLCYQGMAREIGAVLDISYKKWMKPEIVDESFDANLKTSDFVRLVVEEGVQRATKRIATGVQVGPSPQWLVEMLESIGQKSINNVVDITNYVMWETGQPVHAFDYDKIAGEGAKQVDIRYAQDGEKVTDLTGAEHKLDSSMLVIADSEKALDIAGVKGGENSGVDKNTKTVLLSACNFDFQNIRNTARTLKLHTDASKRFENEVPVSKIDDAMLQFAYLMRELAQATVSDEIVDTNPDKEGNREVKLSVSTTNRILGLDLSKEDIVSILKRVGCEVSQDGDDEFAMVVPIDRPDISFAGDLIEEVGRLYGYENLEAEMPTDGFPLPEISNLTKATRTISDRLLALGFYEVKNRTLAESGVVELANPLNKNAGFLRSHLGSDLVAKADRNLAYTDEPRLFEIGKIFSGMDSTGVLETWHWAGVIGRRKIKEKQKQELFLQTKGVVDSAVDALGIKLVWESHEDPAIGAHAVVSVGDEHIGLVGVNWWEINMSLMLPHIGKEISYKKPSKYPRIDRDVAVFVPVETTVSEAEELIKGLLPEETRSFELFDIFEKEDPSAGSGRKRKSFAFRMVFQSDTETLSDEWANKVMDVVYKALEKKGYEIR